MGLAAVGASKEVVLGAVAFVDECLGVDSGQGAVAFDECSSDEHVLGFA